MEIGNGLVNGSNESKSQVSKGLNDLKSMPTDEETCRKQLMQSHLSAIEVMELLDLNEGSEFVKQTMDQVFQRNTVQPPSEIEVWTRKSKSEHKKRNSTLDELKIQRFIHAMFTSGVSLSTAERRFRDDQTLGEVIKSKSTVKHLYKKYEKDDSPPVLRKLAGCALSNHAGKVEFQKALLSDPAAERSDFPLSGCALSNHAGKVEFQKALLSDPAAERSDFPLSGGALSNVYAAKKLAIALDAGTATTENYIEFCGFVSTNASGDKELLNVGEMDFGDST